VRLGSGGGGVSRGPVLCPTPRTGAAGPTLNSRARRGVRNTWSACAGAAERILTFRYLQISLPLLRAEDYVQAEQVLGAGLASVMRLPGDRQAQIQLHLACLRRVLDAERVVRWMRHGHSCWAIWWRPTCR